MLRMNSIPFMKKRERERDIHIVADQNSPCSLTAVLLRMNLFGKAKKYYHRLLDERSININSFVDLIINYYWSWANVNKKTRRIRHCISLL